MKHERIEKEKNSTINETPAGPVLMRGKIKI
jgi:hypothetical protein